MLITLTSLSTETLARNNQHYHLKPGEAASTEMWCYSKIPLKNLRRAIEKCEDQKIEVRHLKQLNEKLLKTQVDHKPLWQNRWVKLPVSLLVGGLTGHLAGESTKSAVAGGLVGALLGTTTVVLLEF